MNDVRARLYERLMEAQDEIAQARYRAGVSDEEVQRALDAVDERLSADERREDLYLAALARYVEVRAVFGDEWVVVRRDP